MAALFTSKKKKKEKQKACNKHVIKGFDPHWGRDAARLCRTTISSACQQRSLCAKCRNTEFYTSR